jgi:hypothetical protein
MTSACLLFPQQRLLPFRPIADFLTRPVKLIGFVNFGRAGNDIKHKQTAADAAS